MLRTKHSFPFLIIIIAIEVVLIIASDDSEGPKIPIYPKAFTVTLRLDHFNKSDTRLWEQKYFISGVHYTGDGPVFVLVGDDHAISSDRFDARYQFMEYAKRYNALCLYLEQRFYGESQPTKDLSLDSLKYFTLDQALEDLVEFRAAMDYQYKLINKQWIFFGSINGGLLATNLRIKYPLLADGVVASCTPMTFKLDSSEILRAAFAILNQTSPNCMAAIESAGKQIEACIEDGPTGWAKLSDKFQVCGVLNGSNYKEIEDFYYLFASVISRIVSGSADVTADVSDESLCQIMNDRMKGPEIDRLAQIMKLYLKSKHSDCAYEHYETSIQLIDNASLYSLYKEVRLDWYRQCTEQANFYAPDDPKLPFYSKYSLSYFIEICAELFGPQFNIDFINSGINVTNEKFGYKAINDQLTNVLIVSNADDPEKSLHISKDANSNVKAILIQGESGCTDTFPSTISDSKELIKARLNIAREIGNWING